ncbi:MAG TPA: hypothetical protein DCM87_05370 [Planctomycetes bacterium]|nr:hypothetical protein [Planctomycetota bacterium]
MRWMTLGAVAALIGMVAAAAGCRQAGVAAPPPGETPLRLDDAPPGEEALLLLDDARAPEMHEGADNSRCRVCHLDLSQEELAVTHARADIGCAGCHGESDAHIADESWGSGGNGTAPERMFPRPAIVDFCSGCHRADKLSAGNHAAAGMEGKVCTDCHGAHRMPVRRCKWK